MRRADRHDDSYDNSIANPRSHQAEPVTTHEQKALLMTLRAQRDEAQQQYKSTLVLYEEAQSQAQSYLVLYNEEQAKSSELLVKYEQAQVETQHYITLYNESQSQLKFERRSKAGIKSWETRRKRENERLKQEIGEMALLLRDSLERKDEAISNLESLADRMDRIQNLVDSVEDTSEGNPLGLLQKLKRIWQAVKDILAE
ncbi:hypothetical protein H6G89_22865 [Oscillatoria sp. FACHB-1407]|uniref:hypothetical protein n=1 Tax=Oscillatoria sp. FACHB-1407 TaxID=2692847 RepID=UPI001689371F|nr:hypothetical protein [Oscillatoria sp. FACHB-1407]MBD2463847.1 hypothetical protein [Oscillatoria sp. FACHB-1407]